MNTLDLEDRFMEQVVRGAARRDDAPSNEHPPGYEEPPEGYGAKSPAGAGRRSRGRTGHHAQHDVGVGGGQTVREPQSARMADGRGMGGWKAPGSSRRSLPLFLSVLGWNVEVEL